MPIAEIKQVCYIGAGSMGCYNALVAAMAGYNATLYDIHQHTIDAVPQQLNEIGAQLVAFGLNTPAQIADALPLIATEADLAAAVRDADLISESVFEQLDIKRQVHQQLDQLAPATTLITTNTSALLVSDIETAVQRGNRFAALHSHLGSPLFDIVAGSRTDAVTIDVLRRYVLSLNGIPLILKKEYPGYIFNALNGPLITSAMIIALAGIASQQQVDRAWMSNLQAPMGPFGMMDLYGLDLIITGWKNKQGDEQIMALKNRIVDFLSTLVDKKHLGIKTGIGFYQYPNPEYGNDTFLEDRENIDTPWNILISSVIGAALVIAEQKIADPKDIDRAWMAATRLAIGPFALVDKMGLTNCLSLLNNVWANLPLLPPHQQRQATDYLNLYISKGLLGESSGEGFYRHPDPDYLQPGFLTGIDI